MRYFKVEPFQSSISEHGCTLFFRLVPVTLEEIVAENIDAATIVSLNVPEATTAEEVLPVLLSTIQLPNYVST